MGFPTEKTESMFLYFYTNEDQGTLLTIEQNRTNGHRGTFTKQMGSEEMTQTDPYVSGC